MDSLSDTFQAYAWGLDLSGTLTGAGGAGGLLGVASATGTNYSVCTEINGNVTGLLDPFGKLVARWDYDAFGNTVTDWRADGLTGGVCPLRFSSKYLDGETQWSYYGYRYFDSGNGRWLGRDPLGEAKSTELYQMLGNNLLNSVDILGREDFYARKHIQFL